MPLVLSFLIMLTLFTGCVTAPPSFKGTSFAEFMASQPGEVVQECGGYCGRMAKRHDYTVLGKRKPGLSLLYAVNTDFKAWCRANEGEAVSYGPQVEILELYRRVDDTTKRGNGLACYSKDMFGSAYTSSARKLLGAMVDYTNMLIFLEESDREKLAGILATRDAAKFAYERERDLKQSQNFACENKLNPEFRKNPEIGMKVSMDRYDDRYNAIIVDVRQPLVQVQTTTGQMVWLEVEVLRFYDAYLRCRRFVP